MHALYIANVIDVVSDKGTPLIDALISHGPCTLSLIITLTNTVLDLAGYICHEGINLPVFQRRIRRH